MKKKYVGKDKKLFYALSNLYTHAILNCNNKKETRKVNTSFNTIRRWMKRNGAELDNYY